jgi:hypothetical protein
MRSKDVIYVSYVIKLKDVKHVARYLLQHKPICERRCRLFDFNDLATDVNDLT